MNILKSFVQRPALLFSIFLTLTGTHVWSADHITTYEVISGNGERYGNLVITEGSRDGSHIFLTDFRPQQQGAGVGVVTNPGQGVIIQRPESDQSGLFESHREEFCPDHMAGVTVRQITLPSYDVLEALSLGVPPINPRGELTLALPIPVMHIFDESQGESRTITVSGHIRKPCVASDGSRFTVSGQVLGELSSNEYHEITVEAVFTCNELDSSVQLVSFQLGDYMTIRHISTGESNAENRLMQFYWNRLERDQAREARTNIWQEARSEYLHSLEEGDRELLRKMRYNLFIPEEQAERAEELYREYEALRTRFIGEYPDTENEGAEGRDAGMELAPAAIRNASSYDTPGSQPNELLEVNLRIPLPRFSKKPKQ